MFTAVLSVLLPILTLASSPVRSPKCFNCAPPPVAYCNFQSYCETLAAHAQGPYLLQNSKQEKLLNFEHLKKNYADWMKEDPNLVFMKVEHFSDEKSAGGTKQLEQNRVLLKAAQKRLEINFEKTRNKIIQLVKNRQTSLNKEQIQNLIRRLESVKLLDAASEYTKKQSLVAAGCDKPNAFYAQYNHTISFCPQMMTLPEGAMTMIMAHELAHSMDPCSAARVLTGSETSNGYRNLTTRDTIQLSKDTAVYATSIYPDQYPFKDVIQCLKKPESAAVKTITADDIFKLTANSYSGATPMVGFTLERLLDLHNVTYENRKSVIQKYIPKFQYCSDFSGFSYMSETFADWIASEVIAQELTTLASDKSRTEYALESLGFLWQRCPDLAWRESADSSKEAFFKAYNKQFADNFHLSAATRVEKVFFANAQYPLSLQCKPQNPVLYCN